MPIDAIELLFRNPFNLLRELTPKPQMVSVESVRHLSDQDRLLLHKISITVKSGAKKRRAAFEGPSYSEYRSYSEIVKTGDIKDLPIIYR